MAVTQAQRQEVLESLTAEEVIAWADGIHSALGTEYAARVTEQEAILAHAILLASGSL
jgi:hypothetical protein